METLKMRCHCVGWGFGFELLVYDVRGAACVVIVRRKEQSIKMLLLLALVLYTCTRIHECNIYLSVGDLTSSVAETSSYYFKLLKMIFFFLIHCAGIIKKTSVSSCSHYSYIFYILFLLRCYYTTSSKMKNKKNRKCE